MTVELRRYCIRTAEPLVPRQAAIPENLTFQPFANPRTGANLPSRKLSMTCSGFLGGVFAFSEALCDWILKDS